MNEGGPQTAHPGEPGRIEDISATLGALSGLPLLVIGDVMLDRFLSGEVERISPEGPIPVLRIEAEHTALGGAGNVLRNLSALGAAPRFLSVVGDDAAGARARELAAEATAAHETADAVLLTDPALTTTVKQRFLAGGRQLLRADHESRRSLTEPCAAELRARALALLDGVRGVLISDYGKGALAPALLADLIAAARAKGLPVVVDPKGSDYARYRGATWLTPNRQELRDASGIETRDAEGTVAAARLLIDSYEIEGVLATRGPAGMAVVAAEHPPEHLSAEALEVFDVSGAGDTVLAAFGAALSAGSSPLEAARLANTAAGVVVGKPGTAVAKPGDVLRAAQARRLHDVETKVVDLSALVAEVRGWQSEGLRVGFTNGCFDLLHPGHISLIGQARAACDRLIVGLNSDASVARLKGPSRPVQDEAARAAVLASLGKVDRVVIFGEDTPLRALDALRPDLLVKGADYALDQVVGGDLVTGYGGQVLLAELLPGHSTSETLRRLGA